MKFSEQERALLTDAGFVVSDNDRAAYVEALIEIAAHDEESYWLTLSLPAAQIVCTMPRDQMTAVIAGDLVRRRSDLQ